jgi:isoleucyl-tRNA synthetase
MERRSFLKYATVCNTVVFFPAVVAGSENTEGRDNQSNQLFTLSLYLTDRKNIQGFVCNQLLSKIEEAGQISSVDRLYQQWLIFMQKREADKSATQFLQFLQQTNQQSLLRLCKNILSAWYLGIAKFKAEQAERLVYQTALIYVINQDIHTAPSFCGGAFGFWQLSPIR